MSVVIEWAPFTLKPGASEQALLEASARLQKDFLQPQPGFLRRELLRAPDGGYIDVVWWASHALAADAMNRASESATCRAYFGQMDADHADPGAGVIHFVQLKQYG